MSWSFAARFTTGCVRLDGQEPGPSKCVQMSTSRVVRKDVRDWTMSCEENKWTVKLDVRDLGGSAFTPLFVVGLPHFLLVSGWSLPDFCCPAGLAWEVQGSMFVSGALHGRGALQGSPSNFADLGTAW